MMIQRLTFSPIFLLLIAGCTAPAAEGGLGPAPVLNGIQVAPGTAVVAMGDSLALTISGQWSDGSSSSVPVGWAATGGAMGPGGVFHAGSTPGQFLAIATTAAPQHSDTAFITVQ